MNKKIQQNRYKPEAVEDAGLRFDSGAGIDFCLKCIMTVACISILSLAAIFVYDFVVQSPFFNIKKIEISGIEQVTEKEILELTELTCEKNIFGINLFLVEKHITSHPWIQSVSVKRTLSLRLMISIIEHQALAIVKIENLADILINKNGQPFKEYNPLTDHLENLPVISGIDLTNTNNHYMFNGTLFNSIMEFLKIEGLGTVRQILGNEHTGITIETRNIYNRTPADEPGTIQIKLGFDNYRTKLKKAKKISEYIDKHFPDRTICAMDLFNIEKVFIKIKRNDALHNNLEKGV